MPTHDPVKFVTDLSAKLATRSRHVCAFLGAGAARACGLPDITHLQERVLAHLQAGDREALEQQLAGRNLEQALSRLRRIAALLSDDQQVDGLTAADAGSLDGAVCRAVVTELDLDAADLDPMLALAAWAVRADYNLPLELFTVNYDLLIETALERRRVPYFDGFIGSLQARFHTELVETAPGPGSESVPPFFTRLWKLHGSVNWAWADAHQIVRLGQSVGEGHAAAIYPSDAKYEESQRVPFVVLQDRFRRALHQPETLALVTGYSFGDDHLNELMFDAAARRERSELVAFCHSEIPGRLAERALTTPNIQAVTGNEAIIGGVRGDWAAPDDPPPGLWQEGQLALRDFRHLAGYLARSATRESDRDPLMRDFLERVVGSTHEGTDYDG